MQGAELLIKALQAEGVDTIFGYPGGAIMPVYDALVDSTMRHILVRHEQGAVLAADGYARSTGRVGVCLSTSGPGATNMVTGLANAYMDSAPIVAITGQVSTSLMGTDAFQEVDIFGISLPVVKHSFIIRKASEIAQIVHDAFEIARSGRPGPVLIDFPKDVASTVVEDATFLTPSVEKLPDLDSEELERARLMLRESKRPIVYAGGGVRIAQASEELRKFVSENGLPVVSTLQGLGGVPADEPLFLGMLGMHGTKTSNLAVQDCDLLICVGARFDDRVTGKLAEFAPKAKVIHMDVDPAEVSKLRQAHCPLIGDIKKALNALRVNIDIKDWVEKCQANKEEYAFRYDAPFGTVYAPKFINELAKRADDNTIITCDVGQHQMWVAQHYLFNRPEQHLTSGGLGTMGYGLPAAIGAQLACPDSRVIVVSGDGSIMMNIQELATMKRYDIPVKILLFDNKALGMVRQWQELFFEERYSEVDLSDNPDFVMIAEAFGIPALRVETDAEISNAIDRLLNDKGPLFVHVLIDPKENVWPLVPPGKSNEQMMEANTQ
jgi:acetolactate synthase-1/2/3 large subunit